MSEQTYSHLLPTVQALADAPDEARIRRIRTDRWLGYARAEAALTALEDLLDGWPGTLVIASHDRYFVERVSDSVHAITDDGGLRHLPGGVEQYLRLGSNAAEPVPYTPRECATVTPGAVVRAARKEIRRLEGALDKLETRERSLHEQMELSSSDHARLNELHGQLDALRADREELETAWLEISSTLEP